MKTLKARWAGTEQFIHVDYVANLDEANTVAMQFQLDHHVHCAIEWKQGDPPMWFGQNKFVTFRLSDP